MKMNAGKDASEIASLIMNGVDSDIISMYLQRWAEEGQTKLLGLLLERMIENPEKANDEFTYALSSYHVSKIINKATQPCEN